MKGAVARAVPDVVHLDARASGSILTKDRRAIGRGYHSTFNEVKALAG
jgi:hypothetical protein